MRMKSEMSTITMPSTGMTMNLVGTMTMTIGAGGSM